MGTYNTRSAEYNIYYEGSLSGLGTIPSSYTMPNRSAIAFNGVSVDIMPKVVDKNSVSLTPLDLGKWLRLYYTESTDVVLAQSFVPNAILTGVQAGEGRITFRTIGKGPGGEDLINPVFGYTNATRAKGSVFALIHVGGGYWDLMGDLAKDVV